MIRWLALYLRSRRMGVAIAVSIGAVALIWAGWSAFTDNPRIDQNLAIMTVLFALAPLIPTLSGDDDSLESTAALPWPPRRALHLAGFPAVVVVPLLASAATGATFGPAGELVRNAAGLTGLIGLGCAAFGARMAWQVPICWTVAQMLFAGTSEHGWREALFWLFQPAASKVAAGTAIVLLLAGMLAYAVRVGPRLAASELQAT